jgi:hypothetical protein
MLALRINGSLAGDDARDQHLKEFGAADIVGLYVDPPAHAVVLSVDEKSQIQALDRTQPGLPIAGTGSRGPDIEFARDSPVEEAVMCEPVS